MEFWDHLSPFTLLTLSALLVAARGVSVTVPVLRRLALPPAIVAGGLGLLLGPAVLGWLSLEIESLEVVVYHALALLYISMALQAPPRGALGHGARSVTFGIPLLIVLQGALGMLFVLLWPGAQGLHPGFGLMLGLGFSQGPGQALAIGTSWESSGFEDGGQVGLLFAGLGFAYCSVLGVAIFHLGRRLGWDRHGATPPRRLDDLPGRARLGATLPGDLDALTAQIALTGGVYLGVWGLLTFVAAHLGDPKAVDRLWGFHFIFALVGALGVRKLLEVLGVRDRVVDDALQTHLGGLVVDLAAVSAIAAVRFDLLEDVLGPALLLALLGGALTTLVCLWVARRAFPEHPLAHALLLFGCSTGTLPTGLVLVRLADPELQSGASRSAIMGMPGAVLLGIPLILFVIPMPVRGWPESAPGALWLTAGVCAAYALGLFVLWRLRGPLRPVGRLSSLWPSEAHPLEGSSKA